MLSWLPCAPRRPASPTAICLQFEWRAARLALDCARRAGPDFPVHEDKGSDLMAYWRQSPPQMQAATEAVAVAPSSTPAKPAKSPRSRMMRQYDLVQPVKSYNPPPNHNLLKPASVHSLRAH